MKRIFVSIVVFLSLIFVLYSQNIYKLGFSFEISNDKNWGDGRPVITNVYLNSLLIHNYISPGDIVMKINEIDTKGLSIVQVNELLKNNDTQVLIEIKNIYGVKSLILKKDCYMSESISEEQLANAFSFYSLKDVNDRIVKYPIEYKKYNYFSFIDNNRFSIAKSTNLNTTYGDKIIDSTLIKLLKNKGFIQDDESPDLMVEIYYDISREVNSVESNNTEYKYIDRYNFDTRNMDKTPILEFNDNIKSMGPYTIKFGVNIIDVKNRHSVWTAEINEQLSNSMDIVVYAKYLLPVMFRSFPYTSLSNVYHIKKRHYNYTGIYYKLDNFSRIISVDDNSPAYLSGIRAGDEVVSINGIPINTSDQFKIKEQYVSFLKKTDKYRLPITQSFVDANGLFDCRFWDPDKYNDISNAFEANLKNMPFSYLFLFNLYINDTGNNGGIVFTIKRNKKLYSVLVKPQEVDYTDIIIE